MASTRYAEHSGWTSRLTASWPRAYERRRVQGPRGHHRRPVRRLGDRALRPRARRESSSSSPNAAARPRSRRPGREADALLVNMASADAAAIESLERCRVISRYGVGLDNIDLEAARRRGIAVANVPGYCDREVGRARPRPPPRLRPRHPPARPRRPRGRLERRRAGAARRRHDPRHPGLRGHRQGLRPRRPRPGLPRDPRLEPAYQRASASSEAVGAAAAALGVSVRPARLRRSLLASRTGSRSTSRSSPRRAASWARASWAS